MGIFTNKIRQLRGVTEDQIETMVSKVMKKNEHIALTSIKIQLLQGQDGFGKSIGKYRSKSYAQFKKTLNPRGVVDLKVTGAFWDAMYMDISVFPFLIDSKDSKRNKLVSQYGDSFFHLQTKNTNNFVEACKPDIQQGYRRLIRIR